MYPLSPRTKFPNKLIALDLLTPETKIIINTFTSVNSNSVNPKNNHQYVMSTTTN